MIARTFGTLAVITLAFAASGPAFSQTASPEAREFWRRLTQTDVETAYTLIRDNHPAAAASLGDQDFRKRLEDGYSLAKQRAAAADGYGAYANTLTGFAGAFGDDHIAFHPTLTLTRVRFAGYLMALHGDDYRVAEVDPAEKTPVAVGDRLVSCDGMPAAELAARRLAGFRGDWSSKARRYPVAPLLFADNYNPFVPLPRSCAFDHQGSILKVALTWREVAPADLIPRIRKAAPTGQAGMGVRTFAGGYWIGLQQMNDKAAAVIKSVREQIQAIRAAPFVVVDLRGNGGGNSRWGDQLALTLWGEARLRALSAAVGTNTRCGSSFWRASPDNLKTIQHYRDHPETFGANPEFARIEEGVRRAITQGKPFNDDVEVCLKAGLHLPDGPLPNLPPSPLKGQVIVLTDVTCFSSCLIMVGEFKALGAVHAGQSTPAWSHYMEVRDMPLPSGLGSFSTLQAVNFTAPSRVGPFMPDRPYDGDISDTAALEHWIVAASGEHSNSR